MKKFIYLIALLLSVGLSLNAQIKAKDGIPVTILDNDSVIADTRSSMVYTEWPAIYSVQVKHTKVSGTADGYLVWEGSNDGVDWIHTDSLLLNNDKSAFLITGTTTPYKYYAVWYNEITAAGQNFLITFFARRKY